MSDDYVCHERCAQEKLFFPLFIWAGGDTESETGEGSCVLSVLSNLD